MALYYDMFTRWLTPDVKTYGSATSACDEGVKVDQALEFFHLMQHSWETTDIVSYKDAHRRLCEMSWLHQSAFVCLPFFLLPPSSLRLPPSCCDPVLPPISPSFPPSLLPPSSLLPAKYGVDYQSFRLPTKSREGEKGGREATIPSHLADPDHDRLHGGCGLCRGACGARSRRVGSRSPDHQ